MYKTLSYIVLAITAVIGLSAVYHLNGVTGVLKQLNEEEKHRGWDEPGYDEGEGAIEPEPTDYAEGSE